MYIFNQSFFTGYVKEAETASEDLVSSSNGLELKGWLDIVMNYFTTGVMELPNILKSIMTSGEHRRK